MFSYTTGSGEFLIDGNKITIKKRPLFKKFITTKTANEITKVEYMLPDKSAKKNGFIRFFYDGCPSPAETYPNGKSSDFVNDILLVKIYYDAYEWEKHFKEALIELSTVLPCEIVQLNKLDNIKATTSKFDAKHDSFIEKAVTYKISPTHVQNALQEQADNYIRIIKESVNIVDKTTNPDTFFSRYTLTLETLDQLIELQNSARADCSMNQQIYRKLVNNKQTYIQNFISRYWKSAYEKIITLKTEKARENNRQKFIDSLKKYDDEMSDANKIYYMSISKT